MTYWGYHYLLDCSGCKNIKNRDIILEFTSVLVKNIDMVAIGSPQLEYCLQGTDNEGYSLLQLITTSNITAHFVTKSKTAYIDIFSCKNFDTKKVDNIVYTYFRPTDLKKNFLLRNA